MVQKYEQGLPTAGQKVAGLWWIEGLDGFFFIATSKSKVVYWAFDLAAKKIVCLTPASKEAAAEVILKDAEEQACWDSQIHRVILDF